MKARLKGHGIAALILSTLALIAGTAAIGAPADAASGSLRIKSVATAPHTAHARGIFDGARVYHHNPDNGWNPPVVVICQGSGDKFYLYEGDSAREKGCDDVGQTFIYANSSLVNQDASGDWHTLVTNHGDHGYYLDNHNGQTWDVAFKRAT